MNSSVTPTYSSLSLDLPRCVSNLRCMSCTWDNPRIYNGPSQPGHYHCLHSNFCGNYSRSQDTPKQVRAPPTPPKIHLDHTLPFWKQSRHRRHPPTTPNASSPPDYCQHSNSCGNCLRTCEDTSNLVRGPTYTFQNHTRKSNHEFSDTLLNQLFQEQ